ncbi:methyltransferase-like protein 7A [Anguilla anguilla]|uniref:Methyltransferase type 11 domain-containing protein n=1 Tax=Anguilla anguilla TaxID=7936 RepID=A0A9D3LVG3_ANGAN|nr:methyltransferase-like protein 7A [Anguilla anguilla]KAG5836469.1 hypothetical protein ANANG_G00255120 [Anguilla anguilla]
MSLFMTICTLPFKILALPLNLMEFMGIYSLYKRVFPVMMYRVAKNYNQKMYERKKELFSNLSEFAGPDGTLRILEIGCGTGANFKFYPSGSKVICTDPNPHFQSYLQEAIAANDQLEFEKFVVSSAENLSAVSDNAVDVVVSTLVLCSVDDVKRVLEEAHRILRPGGALYFMEHVASDPASWTHFFQHVLQPLWYYFGDGCEVTRVTWKELEASKFSDLKLRHIEAPLMFMIRPHIVGYAVK